MPHDKPNAALLLSRLCAHCAKCGGSDVHLSPNLRPHLRSQGALEPMEAFPVLAAADLEELAGVLADGAALVEILQQRGSMDGALTSADGDRFRFNIFRTQKNLAISLRRLEERFRPLVELGLAESLYDWCRLRDGLVIVSGPTGAGKSTTLATLVDYVNRNRSGHIITIEDPIEYLHRPVKCIVHQRQVGLDVPSFNHALVASLRQDPDVILVGEIRDLDTIRTAITAAETGHLVFTTLHAGDCVGSIERLVSVFPADEQEGIRRQLALVLRGVLAQHLLPTVASEGAAVSRVPVAEILHVTPAVANIIATGKTNQIYSQVESGASLGMQTLEQDLARLWVAGKISEITATMMARSPQILRERAQLLRKNGVRSVGNGGPYG